MIFFMQCGFAMLCAGSVRQKNVKNIMLKNILDAVGGALGFWSVGFAFAYESGSFIGEGGSRFFLNNYDDYIDFFFQFTFAATAATIVAGTVAERCKMTAYLCYSLFLTAFVYPIVVHAIWNTDGFLTALKADDTQENLFGIGMIDFAGSGVVHMTGGVTALVAAVILGPRLGRFYDESGQPLETPNTFPPHSVALQVLGTFILWFGWYGFNPGSTLGIVGYGNIAALCAVTTTLAAATGSASALFTSTITGLICEGEAEYDLSMVRYILPFSLWFVFDSLLPQLLNLIIDLNLLHIGNERMLEWVGCYYSKLLCSRTMGSCYYWSYCWLGLCIFIQIAYML